MQLPILLLNELIFDAQSMSTDLTSSIIDLGEAVGYCAHFVWTGSPEGSVIVQASNFNNNLDSFVEVDSQATGGTDGNYLLNIERAQYRYVRVLFSRTSGTGTLNTRVSAKRG